LDVTAISLFHVVSGQTLGGYGTVLAGATGIAEDAGSTVSPGDTIGTLSITGNDTLGGTLLVEQNDADSGIIDQLNVSGAFDISAPTAGVNFSVTGTPAQPAYIFARYGSLIGTSFANTLNVPAGYTIDYNYQGNNDIALVAVPEPASLGVLGIGAVGLLSRRRRKIRASGC
jgi:fibronectin-binding autotransporter adhesin